MSKNADPDKYSYSGYGTAFDGRRTFSLPNAGWSKNVIIFGVDMSSSTHADNEKYISLNSWQRSSAWVRQYYINCRSRILY